MAGLKRKADGVRGAEHDQQADVTGEELEL